MATPDTKSESPRADEKSQTVHEELVGQILHHINCPLGMTPGTCNACDNEIRQILEKVATKIDEKFTKDRDDFDEEIVAGTVSDWLRYGDRS